MIASKIDLVIEEGLKIAKEEFEKDLFLSYQTPFVSILIWQCLNTINNPVAKKIVGTGVERLLKEKNKYWSFNYWLKNSEKYKNEPYPDDLDDTFCALELIHNFDPTLIEGKDFALIANLLVACEEKTGGPYKTWLVLDDKERKWSDIDLAVNCNVGYFLKSQEIEMESINFLLEKAINKNKLISPYYKGKWPIIYFISRFYQGKERLKLIKMIEKNINENNSVMEKAIALSSLIRLKSKNRNIWEKVANQILKIDSCKSEDFYLYIDGNKKYIGDKSLTVALVIEALNLFQQKSRTNIKKTKKLVIKNKVLKKVKKQFIDLEPEIKKQFSQIFRKITKEENTEVILMSPFAVAKSLTDDKKIKENFLIKLSAINVLGWMAYTIYDDLMDKDKPVDWLPMANIICRKMDVMFVQILPNSKDFLQEYQKIMEKLEEANFWELNNCRSINEKIPDFSDIEKIANRSMGHALTSTAVLYEAGASKEDILKLKIFFQFFLAARQMNDDAHDWEDDLKKGQINSAAAEILKLTQKKNNYDNLKLIFWEKVFDKYAERILNYCSEAKSTIKQITCLKNSEIFDKMVDKVIKSTQLALDEKKQTIDFINNYYKK